MSHTRRTAVGLMVFCLSLLFARPAAAGGGLVTPVQTQSTSSGLVATDWQAGTPGITNPLVFNQFNSTLGTLTGIDVSLTFTIRNDYILTFVNTPIPTTIDVATSATSDPSILANPAERERLTDGPSVTLFGPNGTTELFGPPSTRQPVDFVQLTKSSGTWSSLLPITNPNYIAPTMSQQTLSLTLTAANSPALFADFLGTGKVDLPVTATAFSSFYSSTGNGGGGVLTTANASVSIQYIYASAIPEPSSVILLAVGMGATVLACRGARLRAARSP